MSDDIYREIILDHYRNPRNKGKLPLADISVHDSNPLCGDEIDIHLKIESNKVEGGVPLAKQVLLCSPRWLQVRTWTLSKT